MRLQEVNLFDERGERSFVLVVLNLLLELGDAQLVVLEGLLHSDHVVFIGKDELGLLALQHRVHLILQVVSEAVHRPHRLLDIADVHLPRKYRTLYLLEFTSGMFITIYLCSAILL